MKSTVFKVTAEDLAKLQEGSIKASLAAIKAEPTAYANLKSSVSHVLKNTVDVDEWEHRANEIADSLSLLVHVSKGTYFYYPWKNINPEIYGKAPTFRTRCQELGHLFRELGK